MAIHDNLLDKMKVDSFYEALSIAVPIINLEQEKIGSLVPVGNWILSDKSKIEDIRDWRQKAMKMFLSQFESTYERTLGYLTNLSIAQENRILFLIYDASDRFVGHIGMADIDTDSGELDNLMRGVAGGDPRLVYFSELTLLNWCFTHLNLSSSDVRVISYNWMVISLHEEVGFKISEQIPLRKREQDGVTSHDYADPASANVKYSCTRMVLKKSDFYNKASWLKS